MNPDAFGNSSPKTYKMKTQILDMAFHGLLLLRHPADGMGLSDLLWRHTRLMFRPSAPPFCYQNKENSYTFATFSAFKPSNRHFFPFLVSNQAENANIKLFSYKKPAISLLSKDKNTLPNQLSLFPEEKPPLTQSEDYTHLNAEELQRWNEIGRFLQDHSTPLAEFQYLMPLSIQIGEMLYPFLIHLQKIEGLYFKFIAGDEVKQPEIFYLLESYRNKQLNAAWETLAANRKQK